MNRRLLADEISQAFSPLRSLVRAVSSLEGTDEKPSAVELFEFINVIGTAAAQAEASITRLLEAEMTAPDIRRAA